jgi:hypothetical protein
VTGLAIAGNPENDGYLSPWQEAVGHEIRDRLKPGGSCRTAKRTAGAAFGGGVIVLEGTVHHRALGNKRIISGADIELQP